MAFTTPITLGSDTATMFGHHSLPYWDRRWKILREPTKALFPRLVLTDLFVQQIVCTTTN